MSSARGSSLLSCVVVLCLSAVGSVCNRVLEDQIRGGTSKCTDLQHRTTCDVILLTWTRRTVVLLVPLLLKYLAHRTTDSVYKTPATKRTVSFRYSTHTCVCKCVRRDHVCVPLLKFRCSFESFLWGLLLNPTRMRTGESALNQPPHFPTPRTPNAR